LSLKEKKRKEKKRKEKKRKDYAFQRQVKKKPKYYTKLPRQLESDNRMAHTAEGC